MFRNRQNVVIVSVLILTVISFVICFGALRGTVEADSSKIRIVLDAGHGGVDGGVSGVTTKINESEINLAITKKLEKLLVDGGFDVVLTRSTDAGLYGLATSNLKKKDMQKRKEIIEKANPTLVVSIHQNNYSLSSRRGGQVFYKKGDVNAKLLAESVQDNFNLFYSDLKGYNVLTGDYYILNCTDYPSVIAECGFLSNEKDEKILTSEKGQEEIAYALFKGIVQYLSEASIKFTD